MQSESVVSVSLIVTLIELVGSRREVGSLNSVLKYNELALTTPSASVVMFIVPS